MSLWGKIKNAALAAKCFTGWHSGEYSHEKGKPNCHLIKICEDCNETIRAVKHEFGDWSHIGPGCNERCRCIHCNEGKEEIRHQHEDIGKDRDCRPMHKCYRCGDLKVKSAQHSYVTKGKNSQCQEIEICSSCGHENTGRAHHNWVNIFGNDVKIQGKRKCRDCGTMQ